VIPRFAYSSHGPKSDGILLAAAQGITYAKLDSLPADSIMDSHLELVMEFDALETLVSVQVLSRPEEVSQGPVKPASKESGRKGYLRILDKACDGEFSLESRYDASADLLELKFCQQAACQTVFWGELATAELAENGEIVRMILEVHWA